MKNIALYAIVIIVLLGGFTVQQYFSYVGPQLAMREAITNDIERLNVEKAELDLRHGLVETQIRREAMTSTIVWSSVVIIVLVVAAGSLMLYLRYDKRKESWHRQIDGSFALQDVHSNGVKWKVDINKNPSGTFGVLPNGMLLQGEIDSTFGPDRQLEYNKKIQTTRTAIAVSGENGGIPNAATGKFLSGYYDRGQKLLGINKNVEVEPEEEKEPVKLLTLQQAIDQSDKTHWIIGQNTETGELSEINIRQVIHVGILGASNTGKTSSTALLTAYYARKSGMDVIVLDSKGLLDWTPFNGVFDVHKTNSDNFVHYLRQIGDMYTERKQKISDLGIEDFYETKEHGLKPVIIFFEEFGKLSDELRIKDRKQYEIIMKALGTIMRDSRSVAMNFVFVDQTTENWNPNIKALIKYWVAYKLEASAGRAINFFYLDKLKDVGQFSSSDNKKAKYDSWHTKSVIDVKSLLKPMKNLLTTSTNKVEFVDPLRGVKNDEQPEENKAEPEVIKVETEIVDEPVSQQASEPQITNKRYYDDLTSQDKELIRSMIENGMSLRTITVTIFGEGKFGKFYNEIVKKVMNETN